MNKLLKATLAILLIGSPVLTTVACRKPTISAKIIDDKSTTNQTTLNEYVENSSHIAKAIILAEIHKFDLQTIIANNINFAKNNNELKQKLKPFFNENYENLFKDHKTLEKFARYFKIPEANSESNKNVLLNLVKLLLTTINDGEQKENAFEFLSHNISEVLNHYKQSENEELITMFQQKITEHNNFIKEEKTYSEVLEWSVDNIRKTLIAMSKTVVRGEDGNQIASYLVNDTELDREYEHLMKNLFNFSIESQTINERIKTNFSVAIKKPENIINLVISALPLLTYLLDTSDKFPKDFTENNVGKPKAEFLSSVSGEKIDDFITKKLKLQYKGIGKTNISGMVKKIKEILSLENRGLSIRKLLLIFYKAPSIKKLFAGIEISALSSRINLEDLALDWHDGGLASMFYIVFNSLEMNLERTLTNLFQKIDKYLKELDSLIPNSLNKILKLTTLEINFQEALFLVKVLTSKNDEILKNAYNQKYLDSRFWSISNAKLTETKINRIITYDVIYQNKGIDAIFNFKFATADLKNNKLQIISF